MGLFDVFNFKRKFQETFTAENFALLRAVIKEEIIKQVKNNVPGQEKMDAVGQRLAIEAQAAILLKKIYSPKSVS